MLIASIVCWVLSIPLWWIDGYLLFGECCMLACLFCVAAMTTALRAAVRPNDTNVLSRSFFTLGIVLLFIAGLFVPYLYAAKPKPYHVLYKDVWKSYGTIQRLLHQDSDPISYEEHTVLRMTDEQIDRMLPMDLYAYYQMLEKPTFSFNFQTNYEAVWGTYIIWIIVDVILFILALLSLATSFFMPKQTVVVTAWSGSEW